VQRRVLKTMSDLSGTPMTSMRDLLGTIRAREAAPAA
jgi:hypothetical protein